MNLDADGGAARVVDHADEVFGDDRREADHFVIDGGDGPVNLGNVCGHEAIDVLRKHVDELGAPLVPPHFRSRDLGAVVQGERIGKDGIGIGLGFVVVGVVGSVLVAAGAGAQRLDAELVHHVLVILIGGECDRIAGSLRLKRGRGGEKTGDDTGEGEARQGETREGDAGESGGLERGMHGHAPE